MSYRLNLYDVDSEPGTDWPFWKNAEQNLTKLLVVMQNYSEIIY